VTAARGELKNFRSKAPVVAFNSHFFRDESFVYGFVSLVVARTRPQRFQDSTQQEKTPSKKDQFLRIF
jgi:hypothetical protein